MDLGSFIVRAQQPVPAKRGSAVDPDAENWVKRVVADSEKVRTLAAFNAARTGIKGITPSKRLAEMLKTPALIAVLPPEQFELDRLVRKAEQNAGRMQAKGKTQQKAYAGQQWRGHVLAGLLAALKSQGAELVEQATAGDPGDVFVSMQTPETATGDTLTIQANGQEIDVRSIPVLVFTPEGMGKLINGFSQDDGFRALIEAFVKAADSDEDLASAIRGVQARATEIQAAARIKA